METMAPTLWMLPLLLGAWIVLPLPFALVIGRLLRRRAQQDVNA